jgi:TonB family protein
MTGVEPPHGPLLGLFSRQVPPPHETRTDVPRTTMSRSSGAGRWFKPAAGTDIDSLSGWLLLLWGSGASLVLGVWMVRWRRVAALVRSGEPMTEGAVVTTMRQLEAASGAGRPLRVIAVDGSIEPGVFGVFKPVLLWPRSIAHHLDSAQIDAILTHELSHVRRRDNFLSALHMAVQTVFWFHPLVWWLGARLVEERERACDEAVVHAGAEPELYAESILRTCQFYVESPVACVTGVTGSNLKKRIEQIMRSDAAMSLSRAKQALLATIALATVAAPVVAGATNVEPQVVRVQRRVVQERMIVRRRLPDAAQSAPSPRAPIAPAATAALSGAVTGPRGNAIANASVVLTHIETNVDIAARTDASGRFSIQRLAPGEYLFGVTPPAASALDPFHGRVTIPANQPVQQDVLLPPQGVVIGTTVTGPQPGRRDPAPMPPSWICAEIAGGLRQCGPPSLLEELEADRKNGDVARQRASSRPAQRVGIAMLRYPQELWDAMVEGSVVVSGQVDERGVPTGLTVVAPVHPDFAKLALEEIATWRFDPAMQDGVAISVPLKVTIDFRLHPNELQRR